MNHSFNIPVGKFAGEGYQQYSEPQPHERQRNGFVTFWLWLGLICSVISGIYSGITVSTNIRSLAYNVMLFAAAGIDYSNAAAKLQNASTMLVIINIVSVICCIIGYVMLLKWRKAGFWVLIGSSIVLCCFNLYAMGLISEAYSEIGLHSDPTTITIIQVGGSFIGWIILWAILQIKKNGISCWSQLD